MSVASSKLTAPQTPVLQGAWATGKTPFITAPEAPTIALVQKAVTTAPQELTPPPAPAPANAAQESHSTPVLVTATAEGTTESTQQTDIEPETDAQLRIRLLDIPSEDLTSHELLVREAVVKMCTFVDNEEPWRADLMDACDTLKAMAGRNNEGLFALQDDCDEDWLRLLACTVEKFLSRVGSLESPKFQWNKMTMNQIAWTCYGLKACYELERFGVSFPPKHSKSLVMAGRKITRKLIDQVHQRNLLEGHNTVGDVLSLLAWIAYGLRRSFRRPDGNSEMLLAGCAKIAGKVSLTDIGLQIFAYFDDSRAEYMTARQIGKLFTGIGELLARGVLKTGSVLEENDIETPTFRQALLAWYRSPSVAVDPTDDAATSYLNEEMDIVVLQNLVYGLDQLMQNSVLEMLTAETSEIVVCTQKWIKWAMSQPGLTVYDLKTFQQFIQHAIQYDIFNQTLVTQLAVVQKAIAELESQS